MSSAEAQMLADERLALMMQNEEFLTLLQRDEEFMRALERGTHSYLADIVQLYSYTWLDKNKSCKLIEYAWT